MINRQRIKQFRREEITLLIDSKIINDYPALKKLIIEKPDLRSEDIEGLSADEQLALAVYERVSEAAANEWTDIHSAEYPALRVGESPEHSVCELCGSTQCIDLFPIANYDGSKILYVGSTCVNRFVPQGRKSIAALAQYQADLRKYARLTKDFPGVYEKFVASNTRSYAASDLPYLVVHPLYEESEKCFKAIRDLCHEHQQTSDQDIDQVNEHIQEELDNYSQICRKIDTYLAGAKDNWLIPTRAMIDRVKTYGNSAVLNQVRKDGCITEKTLSKFDELVFLEHRMLPRLQALTKGFPLSFIGVAEKNGIGGYMVEFKASHVQTFIRHIDIASSKRFGSELINGGKTQRISTLLSLCRVVEETDLSEIIRHARSRLHYYRYFPVGIDTERDEVFFNVDGNYRVIPLRGSIQKDIVFFGSPLRSNPVHLQSAFDEPSAYTSYAEWLEILHDKSRSAVEF
ncbi:MAG: hypothetical protein J6K73_02160 [Clostridia bacterium]|nr:hypothetical protein [Clostridia bacterium]